MPPPLFVLFELFKHLIDAGRSEAGHDADGDGCQIVRDREVRHDAKRQHAEGRADDAADNGNPFVILLSSGSGVRIPAGSPKQENP